MEDNVNSEVLACRALSTYIGKDEYFAEAAQAIFQTKKTTIGTLQRMFKIGFYRASSLMDQLIAAGVVSQAVGIEPRNILMTADEFNEYLRKQFYECLPTYASEKSYISKLKQTIRVLSGAFLAFVLITAVLVILLVSPFFNKTNIDIPEDASRFEGEHRLEEYTLQCEYKSKAEGASVSVYTTDVLKFAGEGYEKVAASIEEYFSWDALPKKLEDKYDQVTMAGQYETTQLECTRMDDAVISIKRLFQFYENGGFYIQDGKTFSVKTGKLLKLDDLLKDKKEFYNIIDELILAQLPIKYPDMKQTCPEYKVIYLENYSEKGKLPAWHLEKFGLAFSFEEGEFLSKGAILPEVCMMVVVPYEQVSAYLKPEYIVQEE